MPNQSPNVQFVTVERDVSVTQKRIFTGILRDLAVICIRRNQVAAFAAMSGHGAERVAGLK